MGAYEAPRRSTANDTRLELTSKSTATSASEGPPVFVSGSASALAEVLGDALAELPLTVTVPTIPISSCGFAWVAAATLALLIPDYRVLVAVAYTPIVLIGAPFGWPPGVGILDVFPWPVVNQFVCIGGGLV